MVSVLIADDMLVERERLKECIDWSLYGIKIVAEAKNGREALRLCQELHPEIVITDMRMPSMSGIELAKQLHEVQPDSRLIFMSAFSDFESARSAIGLNVSDYILKPYTPDTLTAALHKAMRDLFNDKNRRRQNEQHKQMLDAARPVMQREFFLNLLLDRAPLSPQECYAKADNLGLKIQGDLFCLIKFVFGYEAAPAETKLRRREEALSLLADASRPLHPLFAQAFLDDNMLIASLNFDDLTLPEAAALTAQKTAARAAEAFLKARMRAEVSTSSVLPGIQSLGVLFRELQGGFGTGGGDGVPKTAANPAFISPDHIRSLLQEGNWNLIREHICKLRAQESDMNADDVMHLCVGFLRSIDSFISENRISSDAVVIIPSCTADRLVKLRTAGDAADWMTEILDTISMHIDNDTSGKAARAVEQAVSIIARRYNEKIDAAQLSREVYLSESYLRMLFKKHTGKSLSRHLNDIRLQKACELLTRSDMPVAEIPPMVGLSDSPYFYVLFKKHTGITPSEYRFLFGRRALHTP